MYGTDEEDEDNTFAPTALAGMREPRMPSAPGDVPMSPDATNMSPEPTRLPEYAPMAMPPPTPAVPPSRVVSPAESESLSEMDKNAGARMQNAADAGSLNVERAKAKVLEADANSDIYNAHLAERQKIEEGAAARIADRERQADVDYQSFRDFGIKDPQAEQGFGKRLLTGIAVGLGAYAQGIQGGQNNALAIIQKANADNIAMQKAKQEKLHQNAVASGENVELARKRRDDAFKQLDLKSAAMLENSAAELKKRLAQIGVPDAQIAANKDILTLQNEALKIRQGTLQSIRGDETTLARADVAASAKRHAHAANGSGSQIIPKLVEMKENGAADSEIAAAAAKAGLSPKAYLPSLANVRQTMKGQKNTNAGDVFGPGGKVIGSVSTGDPALDRKRGEEVSKANATFTDLQATLGELERLQGKGISLPSVKGVSVSDLAAKREALHSHALIQLKEMAKLGVLAGPDMAIMEQQLGGSTATSMGLGGSKIGNLRKIISGGHEKFLDSVGLNGKDAVSRLSGEAPADEAQRPGEAQKPKREIPLSRKAEALQWARANPRNPKAREILEALGQ